jgi:hypothetical protein
MSSALEVAFVRLCMGLFSIFWFGAPRRSAVIASTAARNDDV